MTVVHGSHSKSIEIEAPRATVWACFAEVDLRHRWFRIPGPRDASVEKKEREGGTRLMLNGMKATAEREVSAAADSLQT